VTRFFTAHYVISEAKNIIGSAICQIVGHKWMDLSRATQNSGNSHTVCSRCGESHYSSLY
jgi:hypothetical protein